MKINPIKLGYVKYVTRSKTRTEDNNQDSGMCGETSHARYIAVADGVGSAKNSKIASSRLVSIFEKGIVDRGTQEVHLLHEPQFIKKFYELAVSEIGEALIQNKLPPNSAATTFIGIIETENRYLVTYLADGSIYRIMQSKDGEKFVAHSLLRTVNSVTSPDTPEQISAKGGSEEPQIFTYTQNLRGDMWIIATDGINDFNPDVDKHIQTEKVVQNLADEIWRTFKNNPHEFEDSLGKLLERWLKRCQTTDDATLAVLISGNMREHWVKFVGQ
ncbi:MAG: protein phosphatase 2C domain-containing protein [Chloroflexota bacterium]